MSGFKESSFCIFRERVSVKRFKCENKINECVMPLLH